MRHVREILRLKFSKDLPIPRVPMIFPGGGE